MILLNGFEPYGTDRGLRVVYTKQSYVSRVHKATTQVNGDADEGIDVRKLKEMCKINT